MKAGEVTHLTFRFSVRPEVVRIREKAPHITEPQPIDSTFPRIPPYSDEAILTNFWGVAWLLLQVDTSGTVADVKVLKGPGHDLEPLAIATAKKFRFRPAHDEDGRPVATQFIYIMEWPSYWAMTMGIVMVPPCKGRGPLNLDSVNAVYRDCEPPPGAGASPAEAAAAGVGELSALAAGAVRSAAAPAAVVKSRSAGRKTISRA